MSATTRIQKAILDGLYATRAHRLLRRFTGGAGAILTFHRVVREAPTAFAPNAHLNVTPAFLGALVDRLRAKDVDIVTLDEALRRAKTRPGRRFVALTFDDGYRDNLELALPVLSKRNAPFTVFVASGMIDRAMVPWWIVLERVIAENDIITGPDGKQISLRSPAEKYAANARLSGWLTAMDEDRQRVEAAKLGKRYGVNSRAILDELMMTWDEVRTLAADPLVTIGAHTAGHYALAKLPEDRARAEVVAGADALAAALGRRPRHFAYPYGYPAAAGEREHRMLAELGFASAVLTTPGVLGPGSKPTALPRISMNGHFQAVRYAEVLLSGAPFLLTALAGKVRPRRAAQPALTASASRR